VKMKVLFLGAHTDDIELGVGGTLIKLLREGHDIRTITFTCPEPMEQLKSEYDNARKYLQKIHPFEDKLYLLTNKRLGLFSTEIMDILYDIRVNWKPDLVITHSSNSTHQDHRQIGEDSFRIFGKNANVWKYQFPWNTHDTDYNMFVVLSEQDIMDKIKLMQCYKSQSDLRPNYFRDDFVRGWAIGMGTVISKKYAEGFRQVRGLYE